MQWRSSGTSEPGDQEMDLPGGRWVEVGPEETDRWSAVVMGREDGETVDLASAWFKTEAEAKAWAEESGPGFV